MESFSPLAARSPLCPGALRAAQVGIGFAGVVLTEQDDEVSSQALLQSGLRRGRAFEPIGKGRFERRQRVPARIGGDGALVAGIGHEQDEAVDELSARGVPVQGIASSAEPRASVTTSKSRSIALNVQRRFSIELPRPSTRFPWW